MNVAIRPQHPGLQSGFTSGLQVSFTPLPPLADLAVLWRDLEDRADGSFFNSWSWIGPWLGTYAAEAQACACMGLLSVRAGERVVALALLGKRQRPWHRGGANALFLHQTGRDDDTAAFIEYNGFLADRAVAGEATAALVNFIDNTPIFAEGPWKLGSFTVAGADAAVTAALTASKLRHCVTRAAQCPWIDLCVQPEGLDGYLSRLSANTRGQIRRSMRLYEAKGPLNLTSAPDHPTARAYMRDLRGLHEETWTRRGSGLGAFSHPAFAYFTAALVEIGLGEGHVDVLRVSAGEDTVGLLLNFAHAGHVYAYQSGLDYGADNRLKPGLVTHALAVAHYRARGMKAYHFMAGDSRYKTSLGTEVEVLSWLTCHRDTMAERVFSVLRHIKQTAAGLFMV